MATEMETTPKTRRSFVRGGSAYALARRLGLESPTRSRRMLKVLVVIGITWLPLVLLSILEGHAFGEHQAVSLLHDSVIYSRFFFGVPLLILAQGFVEVGLLAQSRQFVESGLVTGHDRARFEDAEQEAVSARGSLVADVVMVTLALISSLVIKVWMGIGSAERGWIREGEAITFAGWWYFAVSLPLLTFHLLDWFWVYLLWARFMYRASRLDLKLTPTHPDQAGGLGFLGWGTISFAIVLLAVSAVMSGGFAHEILHRGSSLDQLKFHVIAFVAIAVGMVHLPLLFFSGRLARTRARGLMEYERLIGFHDRAFDDKWVSDPRAATESLLGNPDVSSLARLGEVFEHVKEMQVVPIDKRTIVALVTCALLPMAPLVGTTIPLKEIVIKLAELMA